MASLFVRRVAINARRVANINATTRPLFGHSSSVSPFSSQSYTQQSGNDPPLNIDFSNEESKKRVFNRLLYRSKQRGFLELDLVLGKWVEENIHSLDQNRIQDLVHVLDLENPDLWKWVSGQEQPPETVNSNPVFAAVRERVLKNLDTHSAPETRATPGQPWVRVRWDTKKGGPMTGNQ